MRLSVYDGRTGAEVLWRSLRQEHLVTTSRYAQRTTHRTQCTTCRQLTWVEALATPASSRSARREGGICLALTAGPCRHAFIRRQSCRRRRPTQLLAVTGHTPSSAQADGAAREGGTAARPARYAILGAGIAGIATAWHLLVSQTKALVTPALHAMSTRGCAHVCVCVLPCVRSAHV